MELSKDTLNFYLKRVLEDHKDLYNSMSARIGRNNVLKNFVSVYQELDRQILAELWLTCKSIVF